jgi:membrane protease YdiL (CAAX protease family)
MRQHDQTVALLFASPVLLSGLVSGFYIDALRQNLLIFWIHDFLIWLVIPAICLVLAAKFCNLDQQALGLTRISDQQPTTQTFLRLIFVLLAFLSFLPVQAILFAILPQNEANFSYDQVMPTGQLRTFAVLYFALTAALVEEVFYRAMLGWAIVGNSSAPLKQTFYVLLSATLFGLNHWSQGSFKMLATMYLGVIAAVIYLRFRNLWYCIAGHLLVNLVLNS